MSISPSVKLHFPPCHNPLEDKNARYTTMLETLCTDIRERISRRGFPDRMIFIDQSAPPATQPKSRDVFAEYRLTLDFISSNQSTIARQRRCFPLNQNPSFSELLDEVLMDERTLMCVVSVYHSKTNNLINISESPEGEQVSPNEIKWHPFFWSSKAEPAPTTAVNQQPIMR